MLSTSESPIKIGPFETERQTKIENNVNLVYVPCIHIKSGYFTTANKHPQRHY